MPFVAPLRPAGFQGKGSVLGLLQDDSKGLSQSLPLLSRSSSPVTPILVLEGVLIAVLSDRAGSAGVLDFLVDLAREGEEQVWVHAATKGEGLPFLIHALASTITPQRRHSLTLRGG